VVYDVVRVPRADHLLWRRDCAALDARRWPFARPAKKKPTSMWQRVTQRFCGNAQAAPPLAAVPHSLRGAGRPAVHSRYSIGQPCTRLLPTFFAATNCSGWPLLAWVTVRSNGMTSARCTLRRPGDARRGIFAVKTCMESRREKAMIELNLCAVVESSVRGKASVGRLRPIPRAGNVGKTRARHWAPCAPTEIRPSFPS